MALAVDLVVARWLHFCAESLLFGTALFAFYGGADGGRWLKQGAVPLTLAALAGAMTWAWCSLESLIDAPDGAVDGASVAAFFFETSFGTAWVVRLCGLALLVLVAGLGLARPALAKIPILLLSGSVLVSQAWLGHAAAGTGMQGGAEILAYAVHVLAAAAWLGGLFPLWLSLRKPGRVEAETGAVLLARFSALGIVCVVLILASGLANALFRLQEPSALVATVYGRVLLAKLALFAALIGFAATNRFVLMPRLRNPAQAGVGTGRVLVRHVAIEQGLGAGALLAAAVLGTLSPYE